MPRSWRWRRSVPCLGHRVTRLNHFCPCVKLLVTHFHYCAKQRFAMELTQKFISNY